MPNLSIINLDGSTIIPVNHHSVSILPFGTIDGEVNFVLEQKDPGYRAPFFDRGLNFLGGNTYPRNEWGDEMPLDGLRREIGEEFWLREEQEEQLDKILRQEFQGMQDWIPDIAIPDLVQRIQNAGHLLQDAYHAADFIISYAKGQAVKNLQYIASIYIKRMNPDELREMKSIISSTNGIVTTDNARRGSRLSVVPLTSINQEGMKWAWAYGYQGGIIDHILQTGCLGFTGEAVRQSNYEFTVSRVTNKLACNGSFADYTEVGIGYAPRT